MKCLTSLKLGCACWMGRRAASDIVTLHPSISSKHCSLSLEPTSAPSVVKDLTDEDSKDKDTENVAVSSNRKLISCTITDHSSNGTWILKKKRRDHPRGALKLSRGRPTRINHGDIIYLLAPSHSDSSGYRYCLSNGPGRGEIVVCQLEKEVDKSCGNAGDEIEIKNNTKDNMKGNTNPKKRRMECIDLTVETESKVIHLEEEEKEDDKVLSEDLEKCPLCLKDFPLSILIVHVDNCTDNTSTEGGATHTSEDNPDPQEIPIELSKCVYCADEYPVTELVLHVESCDKKKSTIDAYSHISPTPSQEPLERCIKCFQDFPLNKLIAHSSSCTGSILGTNDERFKDFVPSVYDVDALTLVVLTPVQQRAVNYVQEVSRKAAYEEYPSLCEKVIKLGYTPKDLQKVFHWVRSNAPIIIHINLDRVLSFLTKDTHYRNFFEIGTGGGSTDTTARRSWEDNIFNRIYHDSPPAERVKYGVLNIVGDPQGVRCCYSYGDSFLQLKKVRLRTTFASMDTSLSRVKLSCCEHYGNVLNEYSDNELKAILDVATHRKLYLQSTMITHYKEVQVHGPVSLSENIDCIVVNARHRGNKAIETLLDKFIERNNCNLIWMSPDEPSAGGPTHSLASSYVPPSGGYYDKTTREYEEEDEYGSESDEYDSEYEEYYYYDDYDDYH